MGVQGEDMPGPVVYLFGPSLLVLADHVPFVNDNVDAPDHSALHPSVHDLAVEVERRLPVFEEDASSDELVEGLTSPGVDPGIVRVYIVGQVDIGASDVKEAVRIASRQFRCLLPVHHIVGHGSDLGSQLGHGADGVEGMKSHRILDQRLKELRKISRPA
jgi:hypothetical protein